MSDLLAKERVRAFAGYRLFDYLTQGYVALVGLLILLFHDATVPEWPWLLAGHLLVLAGVHALIQYHRRHRGSFLDFCRAFYPIGLYTFLYLETHHLQFMFVPFRLDQHIIRLEQGLFGCQPSRRLIQMLPYGIVAELFYMSYFSYYIMIFGTGLVLYFRVRRHYPEYVTTTSLIFYVCYLTYIFFPVMGPYAEDVIASTSGHEMLIGPREVAEAVRHAGFYHIMGFIYRHFQVNGGAAFPSSHVAVAIATLWFTFRYVKRIRWVHGFFVILLSVSTVYCGYHYAVDILAGLVVGVALTAAGSWLYFRLDGAQLEERV